MARRWTLDEEKEHRAKLHTLYVEQNRTIGDIAALLHIAPQTVFSRLQRLSIATCRDKKESVNNRRTDIVLPKVRSASLAEFFGVLLGDGHVSHYQVVVTVGSKEVRYAQYVSILMKRIFGKSAKIGVRKNRHMDVYLGSTLATKWLMNEGFVHNKVVAQVDVPKWIFEDRRYMEAFLRGFFDTDGSVYKLTYGMQISLTNKSMPLLCSLQKMLRALGYTPSAISAWRVYLTKVPDVQRFFREIKPANAKHKRRFREITRSVGTQVVNGDWL